MSKVLDTPSSPIDADAVNPKNTEAWEKAQQDAHEAGILWERPEGDNRSAQEIIDDSPLLKNLGNQSGVRDSLELRVGGDIDKDPDAAFRAVQVLEHIEKFGANGTRLVGKDVDNGAINGFTNSGEARAHTEAGRLQDFGKYGFSNLKGELKDLSSIGDSKSAREEAEKLGIRWERPEDDTRSAREIIEDDPLLREFGNHSGVRDLMKERIGDFDKDPDAAYRAGQILRHVEQYDSEGKEISDGKSGNGRIDGFTSSREAEHGTEAGRLQDFAKYGFSSLKGNLEEISVVSGKAEDNQGYQEYLKANPDADEGSRQVVKYAAILEENYEGIREKGGSGKYLDADALQRYLDTAKDLNPETKEALEFWLQPGAFELIDNGKNPLGQDTDGNLSQKDLQNWIKNDAPKDSTSLVSFLSDVAGRNAFADIDTSKFDKDIFQNPDDYSTEEKAAVLQELLQAQQLMVDGAAAGMWKDDYSKVSIANRSRTHPDRDKVFEDLGDHIKILQDDKAVTETLSKNTTDSIKQLIEDNKGIKASLEKTYDEEIKSGKLLDSLWETNTKDGKTNQLDVLSEFYSTAKSAQDMLGINEAGDIHDAVKQSDHHDEFKTYYEESLVTGDRLRELLKDNSFDVASSTMSMEVALYNATLDPEFTAKHDEKLNENYTEIAQAHVFKDSSFDDLKKAFGVDGSDKLDEDKVKHLIEQVSEENPELLLNANGKLATPTEILTEFRAQWDLLRNGTKTLDKMGSLDKNSSAKAASDKGLMHGVSGLFMAGITISKGIENSGNMSDKAIVDITTGSVITATLLTEGGMKNYQQYLKGLAGKVDEKLEQSIGSLLDDPSTENLSAQREKGKVAGWTDKAKAFEDAAKGIGGVAGMVMGAYGIFDGVKAIRNGDKVTGALSIASGAVGTMAGLASTTEAAIGLAGLSKAFPRIPVVAGALGTAAAGLTAVVIAVPFLVEEGKHQKRSDDFGHHLGNYLTKYEIDGVKDGTFRDIPDEEWPGYDDGPLIGS